MENCSVYIDKSKVNMFVCDGKGKESENMVKMMSMENLAFTETTNMELRRYLIILKDNLRASLQFWKSLVFSTK